MSSLCANSTAAVLPNKSSTVANHALYMARIHTRWIKWRAAPRPRDHGALNSKVHTGGNLCRTAQRSYQGVPLPQHRAHAADPPGHPHAHVAAARHRAHTMSSGKTLPMDAHARTVNNMPHEGPYITADYKVELHRLPSPPTRATPGQGPSSDDEGRRRNAGWARGRARSRNVSTTLSVRKCARCLRRVHPPNTRTRVLTG